MNIIKIKMRNRELLINKIKSMIEREDMTPNELNRY